MKVAIFLFSVLLSTLSVEANSCSIAGNPKAEFDASLRNSGIQPFSPTAKVSSYTPIGHMGGSCNDIAMLSIKIPRDRINPAFAYKFKLVSGNIPARAFNKSPVRPFYTDNDGQYVFTFSWIEHENTSINATISITAFSQSGKRSKPQILDIALANAL